MGKRTVCWVAAAALGVCLGLTCPALSLADEASALVENSEAVSTSDAAVSAEGEAALIDGAPFAVDSFSRAQKGSNRELDGQYLGYSYYQGSSADYAVAVATDKYVLVYVPVSAGDLCDIGDPASQGIL